MNVTKLGNDTLVGVTAVIDKIANITTGIHLKKQVNAQLDLVFNQFDKILNKTKNGTNKIQEWITNKTSILKGNVTGKMVTKIRTLLNQQLQSLVNRTLPMLLGNKIQDRIKTELQRLIDMVTPFLNVESVQQQFGSKLRTFAKMIIGKVPGQNPNIVDEHLNKLLTPEIPRLTNKIKQFLNGQLQTMIDQFLQKYSAEKLIDLLMGKANEGLNMLENLVNESIGGLEGEAEKMIKPKLDEFLQEVSDQLLNVEKLKKWIRDEVNKLLDEVTKKLDLRSLKQWMIEQLKNVIGLGNEVVDKTKEEIKNTVADAQNKVKNTIDKAGQTANSIKDNLMNTIKNAIKKLFGNEIASVLSMFQQDSQINNKNEKMEAFRKKTMETLINFVKNKLFGLVKEHISGFVKDIFPDLFSPILKKMKKQFKDVAKVNEIINNAMKDLLGGSLHKLLGNKTQKLVGEALKMAFEQNEGKNGAGLGKWVMGTSGSNYNSLRINNRTESPCSLFKKLKVFKGL